jgi:hypothetical protein
VTFGRQQTDEVLLQLVSGVIGSERDSCHDARVYESAHGHPGRIDETSGGRG